MALFLCGCVKAPAVESAPPSELPWVGSRGQVKERYSTVPVRATGQIAFTVTLAVKPVWWDWNAPSAWELAYDTTTDGFVLDRRVAVSRDGEASLIAEEGPSWPMLGGRVVAAGRQGWYTRGNSGFEYAKPKLHWVKPLPSGGLVVSHEQKVRDGWGECVATRRFLVLTVIGSDLSHGRVYIMRGDRVDSVVLTDGTLLTRPPMRTAAYGPDGTTWSDDPLGRRKARLVAIDPDGTLRPFTRKRLTNVTAVGSSRVWAVEPGWGDRWAVLGLAKSGARFFRKRGRGPLPEVIPLRDGVCIRQPVRVACFGDGRDLRFELRVGSADRVLTSADGAVYVVSTTRITAFSPTGEEKWSLPMQHVVSNPTVTASGELCVLLGRPLRLTCLAT